MSASFALAIGCGLASAPAQAQPAPAAAVTTPRAAVAHGRVVADTLWSPALGVRKQFIVYLPPSYDRAPGRHFPVAYYLHGLSGNEWNWVRLGGLAEVADSLAAHGAGEAIVVMPDGDDGWYTTWNRLATLDACRRDSTRAESAASYCVAWPRYDDYLAHDLVARVDSVYRTRADRAHRAIAGLSMGGYGAMALALRYPEVFGAAASHSGVVSPLYVGPTPYAAPAHYAATVGELHAYRPATWSTKPRAFGADTAGWWARDPGRLAERVLRTRPALMPALFADVGTGDQLADENRAFRDRLAALGVPLTYHEWPGAHTWTYWRAHVGESLAWLLAHIGA
ncbi:MAG TPA: alpha/beta hydrolase family protein [Gemmatirosa sp.]